jgi:hypothetical protein
MKTVVQIENIEEMRRQQGIDDVALRTEVRGLRIDDFVKLTFIATPHASETLVVRITSIRGSAFRGKLVVGPASAGLGHLRTSTVVAFNAAHIHSIASKQPTSGR